MSLLASTINQTLMSISNSHKLGIIMSKMHYNNNNILYTMTFSLHQGGVVMSSQIKHAHSH